jgi:hypothetical protein
LGLRVVLAPREATDDVAPNLFKSAAGSREDPAAKPLAVVQQPEQDMLRLDGAGSELADLEASVEEDLKGS